MMPVQEPKAKRLVLTYTSGPAKDLEQIIGLTKKQPGDILELKMADGSIKSFGLIKVTPRVIRYREIQTPNGSPGLTDAHPAQR